MSTLICPKCGRGDNEIKFIEAFCVDCYPVKIKLPQKIELDQCTRCQKIRLKGDWTPYNEKKISEYILSKCRGQFVSSNYDMTTQTATFSIPGGGIERSIPLEIKKTICQQCSRISGGYYQAIIQLRGNRTKIEKYSDIFMKKLERKTFIAKSEEKDGGLDIYVGSSKAVVEVVSELGLKTFITKKLIGREEGKRLYRTTFAVRL